MLYACQITTKLKRTLPTNKLTQIDDLTRPDHHYLAPEDVCYYLGEYTARRGYAFSDTNNLISNFKKPVDRRGRPEWYYKEQAIRSAARMLRANINDRWLEDEGTLVPVPPSKSKSDPNYDDRLIQLLTTMTSGLDADVRELVVQTKSTAAAHETTDRPRPDDLVAIYQIDENLADPEPTSIAVVDDVLTTGAHFKAMQRILHARFPDATIIGLFVARRVPSAEDFAFDPVGD